MRCPPRAVQALGATVVGLLLAAAPGCRSQSASSRAPSDGGGGDGGSIGPDGSDGRGGVGGGGALDGAADRAGDAPADLAGAGGAATDARAGDDAPAVADSGAQPDRPAVDVRADAAGVNDAALMRDVPLQGTGRTCSLTPGGCLCVAGPTQGACSPASVVSGSDETAVCCEGAGVCSCQAFACKFDSTQQLCTCGVSALVDATASGTRVATCPAPTAGQHCCRSATLKQCVCLPSSCSADEVEVAGCSPATPAICAASDQSVAFCQ